MLKQICRGSTGNHNDLGQGIRDDARWRAYRWSIDQTGRLAGGWIDDRGGRRCDRSNGVKSARSRRERFIVDADAAHEILGINRVSNGNRLKIRAECGEVAASVYQSVGNAEATQGVQRAIDGEALGDTPEIDPDLSVGKTHHVIGQQFDLVRVPRLSGAPWLVDRSRKPSKTLQDWRDGNVERTSRSGIQVDRRPEHLIRPTNDADGILRGELVEQGDVAVRLVKTHQPMDLRDSIERSIDARIQIGLARA